MSVIDEIKERLDIVEVVSQYVPGLKKAGHNFKALCPFHTEKTPSFIVSPERQAWHCFGCSAGGDIFSFIIKKEGVDFGGALRLLAEKAGVALAQREETEDEPTKRLYQINEAAAQYYHHLLLNHPSAQVARELLEKRGIARQTIADFSLGFSLEAWDALQKYLGERGYEEREQLDAGLLVEREGSSYDRFRNRLMFPIRDSKGRVLGFGARVVDDRSPKYLNSPQTPVFDKGGVLYGINHAISAIRGQNQAIIVEGYTDVVTAHQYGMRNVVASMGTALTEKQVVTLKGLTKNIVMALDADAAGNEATLRELDSVWRAASPRSSKSYRVQEVDVRIIDMPPGKDPAELIREDREGWLSLVEAAMPWTEFVFERVVSALDLTNPRDKSTAVDKLAPYIAAMPDPVQQTHYRQKLARIVQVDERTLGAALAMARSKTPEPVGAKREPSAEASTVSSAEPLSRTPSAIVSRLSLHDPLEEYCLSLLLQHPELRKQGEELSPESFERSENRELFVGWREDRSTEASTSPRREASVETSASSVEPLAETPSGARSAEPLTTKSLEKALDVSLHEHLHRLNERALPPATEREREKALADCIRRLRERRLKSLKAQEESLISEAESISSIAELQKKGIEVNIELRELFREEKARKVRTKEE